MPFPFPILLFGISLLDLTIWPKSKTAVLLPECIYPIVMNAIPMRAAAPPDYNATALLPPFDQPFIPHSFPEMIHSPEIQCRDWTRCVKHQKPYFLLCYFCSFQLLHFIILCFFFLSLFSFCVYFYHWLSKVYFSICPFVQFWNL